MWLLYVTFEDLLCIRHPNLSCHLLATRINVDQLLIPQTCSKSDIYNHLALQNSTKKATSVSVENIAIDGNNKNAELRQIHAQTRTIAHVDTGLDNTDKNNNLVSYRDTKRQRTENKDKDLNGATNSKVNISDLNVMALSRVQQSHRSRETMRDYCGDQTAKNKPKGIKYPTGKDRAGHLNDNISSFGFQSSSDCNPRPNQIKSSVANNKRTTRYNPDLTITNAYLHTTDEPCASKCVGSDRRLGQSNTKPAEKNTRSSENHFTHEVPRRRRYCEENKTTTQCWIDERSTIPPPEEKRIIGRQAERMMLKKKDVKSCSLPDDLDEIKSMAQRPTHLFTPRCKGSGDLKRSAGPTTPRGDAITPDSVRQPPKRQCVLPSNQSKERSVSPTPGLIRKSNKSKERIVSPDSGLDRTQSLSDSFDQVFNIDSHFDDPVPQNDMLRSNSTDSSPVTISSGYESDSIPTCEAEIDKIFVSNKSKIGDVCSFSAGYPLGSLHASAIEVSHPSSVAVQTSSFNIKKSQDKLDRSVQNRNQEGPTGVLDRSFQIPDKSSVRNIRATETEFHSLPIYPRGSEQTASRFSPVHRNNYQLTKVARSMFEIIHDLQIENEEKKNSAKKKCRKIKRTTPVRPENAAQLKPNYRRGSTESLNTELKCNSNVMECDNAISCAKSNVAAHSGSQDDQKSAEQSVKVEKESVTGIANNQQRDKLSYTPRQSNCNDSLNCNNSRRKPTPELSVAQAACDKNKGEMTCAVLDHTEEELSSQQVKHPPPVQPGTVVVKCLRRPLGTHNSDFSRANDLPHSSTACNYEDYEGSSGANPQSAPRVSAMQPADFHGFSVQNNNSSVVNRNVSYPDACRMIVFDGVAPYATARIPGCCTPRRDERFDDHVYETIPGDEYLYEELMRMRASGLFSQRFRKIPDHPGHFIPYEPPALPARNFDNAPQRMDHFMFCRENQMISSSVGCNSSSHVNAGQHHSRNGSTSWDGYSYPYSEIGGQPRYFTRWTPSDLLSYVDGIRQPAPKRRENFYLLLNNKQKRADFSESLEIETKLKNLGLVLGDRSRGNSEESFDVMQSIDFYSDSGQQFLQSTYV